MKQTDRLALLDWEKYKEDIARATPVDRNMTAAEREKHREYLEYIFSPDTRTFMKISCPLLPFTNIISERPAAHGGQDT